MNVSSNYHAYQPTPGSVAQIRPELVVGRSVVIRAGKQLPKHFPCCTRNITIVEMDFLTLNLFDLLRISVKDTYSAISTQLKSWATRCHRKKVMLLPEGVNKNHHGNVCFLKRNMQLR
jgi:hypothetical protein